MTPSDSAAPITNLRTSQQTPLMGLLGTVSQWGQLSVEAMEHVPQLTWPSSVRTYHSMRNDSQVDALLTGIVLPAMRMGWALAPNKASDEVVQHISDSYNLPIQGDNEDFDEPGFDFGDHLYHALLALAYGHMFFDTVGEIRKDGRWHIAEMAELMPQTLSEIEIGDDGKLVHIRQHGSMLEDKPLPEGRVVPYVWQKEGSNWTGRSMLRPLYRDWFIKDRILRVNAINIERAGAGIPTIEVPPGATPEQIAALDQMAQGYKAGETAGGAMPAGSKLRLVGVEGQQPDAIRSVNYHDESMARSFLAMFIQLGQTKTGSRALGGDFADMMAISLEAVASWFRNRFNRTVIRRDVTWNWGPDEAQPKLVYETFDNPNLAVADLALLIEKGAIKVETEFRQHIRKKYRLPEEDTAEIEEKQKQFLQKTSPDEPKPDDETEDQEATDDSDGDKVEAKARAESAGGQLASSPALSAPPQRLKLYDQEAES